MHNKKSIVCFFRILSVLSFICISGQVSATSTLFSDDFESDMGSWSNTTVGDGYEWHRQAGPTASPGTGPNSGANGSSYYVYFETSSGHAFSPGDEAYLLSPDIYSSGIQLKFEYHMFGTDCGTISVDVRSGSSWINNVWSISGEQHSDELAAYTPVEIDLSSYNVSQIRFRATAVGGYRADLSLDNIEVLSVDAGPVEPVFVEDPIVKPDAFQEQSYSDSIALDAVDANGDIIYFRKVSGPDWLNITTEGIISGMPYEDDIGLNEFVVEASDGSLTSTATLQIAVNNNTSPTLLSSSDFEADFGDWININDDDENWTRDSGGTPSGSTGPNHGADGSSFYAYLETSSGAAYESGDVAILQGPVITQSDIHLKFKYHMYGSNIGMLAVDVKAGDSWINDVWSISGQQQSSESALYNSVEVDLSMYPVSQVRFRAIASGGYTGDMAIDSIELWTIPSGPVPPIFYSDPITKKDVIQNESYSDSIAADAGDPNGDPITFSKVSGPDWLIVSDNGDLSGVPSASDVGINTFTVQVSDDGGLNSTATLYIKVKDGREPVVISSSGFESGWDDWHNVSDGDDFSWYRKTGQTASSGTGPSGGADGSSYYVYFETSSNDAYYQGQTSILEGPVLNDLTDGSISFKYHMFGSHIGTLAVDVFSGGSWINDVWSISGQQQASISAAYKEEIVDLSAYNVDQIRFRAVAAGDYQGDIALDDIQIYTLPAVVDSDGDGVEDGIDQCPNTPTNETADATGCSDSQRDTDGDGIVDSIDAFPLDPTESVDTDGDGTGNNADTDDDDDGVVDTSDAFPLDATESVDTDGDGIGNNADSDDDNDGVVDALDAFPLDSSESIDTDSDGVGNNADTDDDNDGVVDTSDAFPLDATESVDTDSDGIGNNADTDDDNDGVADTSDAFPLDPSESIDTDSDGIGNNADTDDDNDGVVDASDAFPLDATESVDTDGDGVGNNADTDDDNDGVVDASDDFPLDATESVDTDGDGVGNNADTDDDNDGVVDASDAFPLDAAESVDTDRDGVGNNADNDDDNDGVADAEDAFPLDRNESLDTDGDGVGDNSDTFPLDASETVDTDRDGIGNNADLDDDNDGLDDINELAQGTNPLIKDTDVDGWWDGDEVICQSNPLDMTSEPSDIDGDRACDGVDVDDDGNGLIEIYSLDDLEGTRDRVELPHSAPEVTIYGSQRGCSSCSGYELMVDLDFDGNQDGIVDENDHQGKFWNDGNGWLPLEHGFGFAFEGHGHSIKNLTINSDANILGLTQELNGRISNLYIHGKINKLSETPTFAAGLLGGRHKASINPDIINVHVSGEINAPGTENVGGLIGTVSRDLVGPVFSHLVLEESSSNIQINGGLKTGGLIGHIANRLAEEDVQISKCYANGSVNGDLHVGGLIGEGDDFEIWHSYSTANVTNSSDDPSGATGGIVGYSPNGSYVRESFSTGDVASAGDNVGGIVGYTYDGITWDSYSHSSVSGNNHVGGISGYGLDHVHRQVYFSGEVSGRGESGPLIGMTSTELDPNEHQYKEAFWNEDFVAFSESIIGQPLSDYQLRCVENTENICEGEFTNPFELWDSEKWDFGNSDQYPALIIDGAVYRDSDLDGVYDPIDPDDDNDEIIDENDLCPKISDAGGMDQDSDGIGDACDEDDDNDGMGDQFETQYLVSDPDLDADSDGLTNLYEYIHGSNPKSADSDGDDIEDGIDNCLMFSNYNQDDQDLDGVGDICDVDDDNDGQIEISTIAELSLIRADMLGQSLNGNNNGCPINDGCSGYELISDLDFDENKDGVVNELDHGGNFWNQGFGWKPIGHEYNDFSSTLNGNNFSIRNLYINRSNIVTNIHNSGVGLFANIDGATVLNLRIGGDATLVRGDFAAGHLYVGILAGAAKNLNINKVHVQGVVYGGRDTGGIVGSLYQGTISSSSSRASVWGYYKSGGLVGYHYADHQTGRSGIANSFFIGDVTGHTHAGGLVGEIQNYSINNCYSISTVDGGYGYAGGIAGSVGYDAVISNIFSNSTVNGGSNKTAGLVGYVNSGSIINGYVNSTESQTLDNAYGNNLTNDQVINTYHNSEMISDSSELGAGLEVRELQCVTDTSMICDGDTENPFSDWNESVWYFGSSTQYPSLKIDSDGDRLYNGQEDVNLNGIVDEGETDFFKTDTDGDGIGDRLDLCNGTLPEEVVDENGCSATQRDTDNDGVADFEDAFPLDSSESIDTDSDGIGNNADTDDDNDGVEDAYDDFPFDASESTDTDGDGIGNNADTDDDNDGLSDSDEINTHNTNPLRSDTDSDGLSDGEEVNQYQTDPNFEDSDYDGLRDSDEVWAYHTNPAEKDSDGDMIPDEFETRSGLDPNASLDAEDDFDGDGFSNLAEYYADSDIRNPDSIPIIGPWAMLQGNSGHTGYSPQTTEAARFRHLWTLNPGVGEVNASIAVDGKVYVTSGGEYPDVVAVKSLELVTGEMLWRLPLRGVSISAPSYGNGMVYVHTSRDDNASLCGVDADTGSLNFEEIHQAQLSQYSAPTIYEDEVYMKGGDYERIIAKDAFDGRTIWTSPNALTGTNWEPAVDQIFVYAPLENGLAILDRYSGTQIMVLNDIDATTPVLVEDRMTGQKSLITYAGNTIVNTEVPSGLLLWTATTPGAAIEMVAVRKDIVLAVSQDGLAVTGKLYGNTEWDWISPEPLLDQLVVTATHAFVSSDTTTYAIDLNTQQMVWSYPVGGKLSLGDQGVLLITSGSEITVIDLLGDINPDIDGDGVPNDEDAFPEDPDEQYDGDMDGVGDNADQCLESLSDELELVGADGCTVYQRDSDGDGVPDSIDELPHDPNEQQDEDKDGVGDNADQCPQTYQGEIVGADGCTYWERDSDGDGIEDGMDELPNDPNEQQDEDKDGVGDNADQCPQTYQGEIVGTDGCTYWERDSDGDGIEDGMDELPNDPNEQHDEDKDGVGDNADQCHGTPDGDTVDSNGCTTDPIDSDGDGISDGQDDFPTDPARQFDQDRDGVEDGADQCPGTHRLETADENGCSLYQLDSDGDGVDNALDKFPTDPSEQHDEDGDGVGDIADQCPGTHRLETADENGCSIYQRDSDGDGVDDAMDNFPADPYEQSDEDRDGVGDNGDQCSNTPHAEIVDENGCASYQVDTDGDGVPDVYDAFPNDPNQQ